MPTRPLSLQPGNDPSAADLERLSRQLYIEGPLLFRKMMHYRIRICPYERLISHVPQAASVLDVGCGGGLFLGLLAGTGRCLTAVGFDASVPAIAAAQQMAEHARGIQIQATMDFRRLSVEAAWPAGLFDVVSIIDVMHHVPPAAQRHLFEQAATHVAPQGILLYKDMAPKPLLPALMNRLHDLVLARQWINYLPVEKVESWAKPLGLTLIHSERVRRLWYLHDLRVFRKL